MKKTMTLFLLAGAALFAVSCGNQNTNQNQNTAGEAAHTHEHGEACNHDHQAMTQQSAAFLYESELQWQTPVPGLKRQIMGYNDDLMMVKIDFEAGCDGGGQHSHPHSQSSVVVSGVFEVTIDGVTKTLKAGDGFYAAPNLVHGAVCIEAGTLIDAFSPVRADFLK